MSSTPRPPSPTQIGDTGFVAQFLPNRGQTRFLLGVARLFLVLGVLGSLSVLSDVFAEWHARLTCAAADGEIVSVEQKDSKGVPFG
jgi:hypothetical protein